MRRPPLNPKGTELLLLFVSHPPFLSTFVSYSLLNLVFAHCFSFSFFASAPIFFNHTLSPFLNPLSPSTFPLASFYQDQTTFQPQFLFKEIIFFSDAKLFMDLKELVQNQFPPPFIVFFILLYFIHISFRACFPLNTLFSV